MGWVGTGWVGNHCSRPFEFSRMLTNRKERALRSFARMDGSFAARKHTTSFNPHKLKGTFLANVRLLYSRAHQLSQTIQLILIHASVNSFPAREHTKSLVCLHDPIVPLLLANIPIFANTHRPQRLFLGSVCAHGSFHVSLCISRTSEEIVR